MQLTRDIFQKHTIKSLSSSTRPLPPVLRTIVLKLLNTGCDAILFASLIFATERFTVFVNLKILIVCTA